MAIQNLIVKIGADISDLTSQLRNASSQVAAFAREQQRGFETLGTIGKSITAFGVAASAGLGAAVKVAADFESAMSRVGALSGASAQELQKLTETAKHLGATTSFSATQAAEGNHACSL